MFFNMGTKRIALYRIRAPGQIEALASPARQELVDSLAVSGPVSIAELASDLGRAPDSLYYHVRRLEQVGLVVRRGTRSAGARGEVMYDVPGARMLIDQEPDAAREKQALMRVVSSALRSAERELRNALDSGRAIYRRCSRRNAWAAKVKGWLDAQGELHEKVYNVAWSGDRAMDANGKLPAVGNTVDAANASWTNTIGAGDLGVIWTDPDFDPAEKAFYYARVLEIPTPRWSTYDAFRFGVDLPEGAPVSTQERAYSSPIWYDPQS